MASVAVSLDADVDDGRVGYVMQQVVQNLIASPAPARAAGVIVQRPSVGRNSLHDIPDMVVLAGNVRTVGGESHRGTANQANGDAGMIPIGDVVVKVTDIVTISLGEAFSVREYARIALNNVVLKCNELDDVSG